jgi:porphobilinogen deaminase
MKRVSQQGKTLSLSQRRHIALQAQIKLMTVSPLRGEVDATLRHMAQLKEQGVKHEPLNKLVESKTGTISLAEWMGF